MGPETINKLKDNEIHGDFVGRDKITNIIMLQDSEREFIVTHNADIKPVSYFTGRETELQDLRQRIEEGRKSVLVSGMGGIGKTHICRKLFEEYLNSHAEGGHEPFRHIGYIEYAGDMGSSLQSCLKFKRQDSPAQNREAAWRELEYLASDGKLLLFVDNVNVPIREDAGLERLKQIPGAVVLTSRRTSFSKKFESYRIGFLSTEQCIEIYERIRYENSAKKFPKEEMPDLKCIIENMAAWHTITIEFLAHLAKTKQLTAKELRNELENKGFRLKYKDEEEKLINIQEEYEKLYDLSALTEAEQNILEAFCVFPYIPLEADICNQWLLEDAGVSKDDDVLIGLYRKGWLQFDIAQERYAMHPVFAQFIYEKCKPELKKHSGMIRICQEKQVMLDDASVYECQKYLSFAICLVNHIDMDKTMQAIFTANIAYLLMRTGRYREAEKYYLASIKIYTDSSEEDVLTIRDIYKGLVTLYLRQKKFTEAEKINEKILQIEKQIFKGEMVTIGTLGNLACIYCGQGKYREAEELYKMILEILEGIFTEDNMEISTVCINLAEVYFNLQEIEKAEKLFKRVLKMGKEKMGKNHTDIANGYNSLAVFYNKMGEYEKAEELFEKSKEICEQFLGERHPDTIISYDNLASVYARNGKNEKAEELYKKVLDIRISIFGQEYFDTVSSYNDLAGLYMRWEKYEKAEVMYKTCMDICKKLFGENDPHLGAIYNNLAFVYSRQGNLAKAESMYKQSIILSKKQFGENHHNTAICYNNLAVINIDQEKYQKALIRSLKAFKIIVIKLGIRDNDAMTFLGTMMEAYKHCYPDGDFKQWLEEQMKKE